VYFQTEQPLNLENDRNLPPRRLSWPITASARRFYTAKTHKRHGWFAIAATQTEFPYFAGSEFMI